jgi:hypothetical protein
MHALLPVQAGKRNSGTPTATQSFTVQLVQAVPGPTFRIGSSSSNATFEAAKLLQQLQQSIAAAGTSVSLQVTSRSFEGATGGQLLSNTGVMHNRHWPHVDRVVCLLEFAVNSCEACPTSSHFRIQLPVRVQACHQHFNCALLNKKTLAGFCGTCKCSALQCLVPSALTGASACMIVLDTTVLPAATMQQVTVTNRAASTCDAGQQTYADNGPCFR